MVGNNHEGERKTIFRGLALVRKGCNIYEGDFKVNPVVIIAFLLSYTCVCSTLDPPLDPG